MKHPQDLAKKIARYASQLDNYSCCALVAMWCVGLDPEDGEALATVCNAIDAGVLDIDCTVWWKKYIKWLTGREIDVDFVDIDSIENIVERTPVKYALGTAEHWVGVENGKIMFNSKEHSLCVEKGRPVTCRIITLK